MTDINSVLLVGRLVRDVEVKYLNSGSAVANFAIAVNTSKKTENGYEDEGNFFDVTLFGKLAEALKPYMLKGTKLCVQGILKQQKWTDKDGSNRSKVIIQADNIQLFGSKKESSELPPAEPVKNPVMKKDTSRPVPPGMPTLSAISEAESESFTEDIPF